MKKLSVEAFGFIIKNTPLISIDLIVENQDGKILLGWRTNSPAKNHWFVPGGRILKDELFKEAFARIVLSEIGLELTIDDAVPLGVYEHMYPCDNFHEDSSYNTHYVVNAYHIKLQHHLDKLPEDQHDKYWWASEKEILKDDLVHQNTQNYFNGHRAY